MESDDWRWIETLERMKYMQILKDLGSWNEIGDERSELLLSFDTESLKKLVEQLTKVRDDIEKNKE